MKRQSRRIGAGDSDVDSSYQVSGGGRRAGAMPFQRYPRPEEIDLEDRNWPSRQIERAPRWCSVDLRDGNQALVEPMGWERKIRLFDALVERGFSEIEVGFPSASQTEFDFVRRLIDENRIPDDVTIQVLTQARHDLIDRTFEAIEGASRAIVHFYNSTSPLQRRVVFGASREKICEIATSAAERVRRAVDALPAQSIQIEYSPESFSATEVEFAVEICEAVMDVLEPTPEAPLILNLPATVEGSTPNVYADQVELFGRSIARRDAVVLSVHPHNDRGSAVAAAELALLAGAERVEGTLFGNGERTGNVDVVTLALNMMSQGVDPELDFRDLGELVRRVEYATRLPVAARHPYAGELVFTAFSGSHQDAIRKGLRAQKISCDGSWEVPYLPVDPADIGRSYEAVIRINSQSGKGGVAYVLETEFGYELPRRMQIEFARIVQEHADESGEEVEDERLWALFDHVYLKNGGPRLAGDRSIVTLEGGSCDEVRADVEWNGKRISLRGQGVGPVDAFVSALSASIGARMVVGDYHEHALGAGSTSRAVAYVELAFDSDRRLYGAGVAASIVEATFAAVLSAVGRGAAREWVVLPPVCEGHQ